MTLETPTRSSAERTAGRSSSRMQKFLHYCWQALVHPEIRLALTFPWGMKDFTRVYAVAVVYYLVGSIVPLVLIFGAMYAWLAMAPEQALSIIADKKGNPSATTLLVATVVSFITGFGAEMYYFDKQLRKSGSSLQQVIALNLDSLNGSWIDAVKRSFIALLLALIAQNVLEATPMPRPHQATADMAAGLEGAGLLAFTGLAALIAPFFEEIIFRGCIFNAFRNVFRKGRVFSMLGNSGRIVDYIAVMLSALVFAAAHMDPSAFIQLFVLGVVLAELYRRSGTLLCPMLLHAMNNLLATLLIAFKLQ